jgi:indole-3-glycerol phosphate synthase
MAVETRNKSVEAALGDTLLFAEVKPRSPFPDPEGWQSERSWDELFEIANEYGDWVAVHTEAPWGGALDLLEKARGKTDKKILAKGIHQTDESIEQAIAAGADAVLVVGRVPKIHRDKCLIEPTDLYELRRLALGGLWLAWNSRDLQTGAPKQDPMTHDPLTFGRALEIVPELYCQASYVHTPEDVNPQAKAVLVGTHLPEFVKALGQAPARATRKL